MACLETVVTFTKKEVDELLLKKAKEIAGISGGSFSISHLTDNPDAFVAVTLRDNKTRIQKTKEGPTSYSE